MDQSIGRDFTALLLAAGRGSRIRELTDEPKCLLNFQGETILDRHLRIWKEVGIEKVTLVVGYKREMILESIKKWEKYFQFSIVVNDDPVKYGNTVSMQLGLDISKGPLLVFDADLVYERELLADFLHAGTESQILVGKGELTDIECAKTLSDDKGFARMTVDKRSVSEEELKRYKFVGEAIGILKFSKTATTSLQKACHEFLSVEKNLPLNWEHVMNVFLLKHDVGVYQFPPQYRWIEIDTAEDYERGIQIFS